MERDQAIAMLVTYALRKGLIQPCEEIWATNALLGVLKLDSYTPPETEMPADIDLPAVLNALLDDAHTRGVLEENSIVYRDLFDTALMGVLTPRPAQVIDTFGLSPLPAVRGKRRICRSGQSSRPSEPPHCPHHHQRLAVVPTILSLCVLQRALHLL